jgi:hypothetical protein
MPMMQTRRRFLATLPLAGGIGLVRPQAALAGEGEPEVTSVRIQKSPSICNAPRYVAEEFLRAEGFTDIRYVCRSRLMLYINHLCAVSLTSLQTLRRCASTRSIKV